jgi:AhpD family alkylhydroperoxidase
MKNPAMILPESMQAIQALLAVTQKADLPPKTLALVHLRISQINGCSPCVDASARHARKAGESDERLIAVGAWRHAPYFSEPERAALALAEGMTRLADRADPVPDELWNEARRHYDDRAMSALLLYVGIVNLFNRVNVATGQVAGEWKA